MIALTDSCMRHACLSYKLAIKYEAPWLAERKEKGVYGPAHAMIEQRVFPWLIVRSFDLLYCFVRSRMVYDAHGNWTRTTTNQFYEDQTPQGRWPQQVNEVLTLLDKEIGIETVCKIDRRFISQLDITEPQHFVLHRDPQEIVDALIARF